MRRLIKALWNKLPVSPSTRRRMKEMLPYAITQPHAALRRFGTVDDLYPWIAEDALDTRLYIQNYFSVFYPKLDTATKLRLWLFDAGGKLLTERTFPLGAHQTQDISVAKLVKPGTGTLMWHVEMPETVARLPECRDLHAYFTDRGYIAFVAAGGQTSFMHGIDRYAVFQEREVGRHDLYYPEAAAVSWRPEIPLGPFLGSDSLDVITVNRSPRPARIAVRLLRADKTVAASRESVVPSRGLFREVFERSVTDPLADAGCLDVEGLPTAWSRVMLLRRFSSGSVSPMHC